MRAITVKQPWAAAIAAGAKLVENRGRLAPWRSAVGERIAIHAGKGWDRDAFAPGSPMWPLAERTVAVDEDPPGTVRPALLAVVMLPTFYVRGALLATARLAGVHLADSDASGRTCCSPWGAPDRWHLVLDQLERLDRPVSCAGSLGLWRLPLPVEVEMCLTTSRAIPAPTGGGSER